MEKLLQCTSFCWQSSDCRSVTKRSAQPSLILHWVHTYLYCYGPFLRNSRIHVAGALASVSVQFTLLVRVNQLILAHLHIASSNFIPAANALPSGRIGFPRIADDAS